ncbi:MAG: hypothetical protein JSS82_13020 [Bacteroidetes bacterium]|nr:hypothetical protein [Bacteroidota bacterium]
MIFIFLNSYRIAVNEMTFSTGEYNIAVYTDEVPVILEYCRQRAIFVDEDGMKNDGTLVYLIISKGFPHARYCIIGFNTPVNFAISAPAIYYEPSTQVLFIGAGAIIKTFDLAVYKRVFEKDGFIGFWGWNKYGDYVVHQEELSVGIFNLHGEQLWEAFVEPPYDLEFDGDTITLKYEGISDRRKLSTGEST